MNKIVLYIVLATLIYIPSKAQHYYQDIYSTQQTVNNLLLLKEHQVKEQYVQSFDANMESDQDFRGIRMLNSNYRQLRSITGSPSTGTSSLTSFFNNKGWLLRTLDSSTSSLNQTKYKYDPEGKIVLIESSSESQATEYKYEITESRRYEYNANGFLSRMIHKKSLSPNDSTVVTFTLDPQGRVIEEYESGRNFQGDKVYYRYDDQGRLSDVYRYNAARKRLLPDYMFEYNRGGQLSSMTIVNSQDGDYTIWKYTYMENGLPLNEKVYGKEKSLLGMIKYNYTYYKK